MSGFEVIGVVLGTIPLLISAFEHYERGIQTIQIVRRRAKVMHSLAAALSTEQTILRNTCETLLAGIVNPEDLGPLLAEPFGPLWQDPDTRARVERRLDHTLKDFKALVHSMQEAVEEIRSKLSLGPKCEIRIDDGPIGKRDMIKIALQFSTHENSLKRLSDMNQKLDLMMTGNLRNEPYRKVPSQEKLFNLLQAISRSIYNALKSSLSCSCARSHGISFGLPAPRVMGRIQDEEALVKRLNFHLVFANKPQDAKGKTHSGWVWDELVLRLAEIPINVCATAALPAASNVVAKKARFSHVRFIGDNTFTPLAQAPSPSPLDKNGSTQSRGVDVSCQATTDPIERITPHLRETRELVQVKDICRTLSLSNKRPHTEYQGAYGYLLDTTAQKRQRFEVFPLRSSDDNSECATINLCDAFSQKHRPSLARKYHIASTAASSILFMHNTRWMPPTLTTKDVFLILRNGQVNFDELYLAKKSLAESGDLLTVPNYNPSCEEGELTLYYLGIFLMEVILWKPVYQFWDDEGVDLSGTPLEDIFDYTTAKGFARIEGILKRIEWISSSEVKEAVEHCIKCDLRASIFSLDDDAFRQVVYSDIVLPLQDANRLANGRMIAGKVKPARAT
ncbi:hypothetical protein F5Y10DRAFT_256363 [Nemania abortiva]|nr:hypothetical protein F5Y10DRAFT_256363 [Nemania abortiva]